MSGVDGRIKYIRGVRTLAQGELYRVLLIGLFPAAISFIQFETVLIVSWNVEQDSQGNSRYMGLCVLNIYVSIVYSEKFEKVLKRTQ